MSTDNPLQPVCDFLSILDDLEQLRDLSPQNRRRLAGAFRAYINRGTPIERSLGLVSQGQPGLIDRIHTARADQFLELAIRNAPVIDHEASDWKRCQVLAGLLDRYQAVALASDLRRGCTSGADVWRTYAFIAAQLRGGDLPTTPEALNQVLKRHRSRSLLSREGSMATYFNPPPCPDPPNDSPSSEPSDRP